MDKFEGKNLGHELLNACYFGNVKLALELINNNACINYMDKRDGWAAIHYAARWGKIRILAALVKAGIDINIKTFDRETALHKACRSNRKNVCVWLISNGANPYLVNYDGNKPADLTIENDIKYICNNFDEYMKSLEANKKK
jgi:ankyrin repeat protein